MTTEALEARRDALWEISSHLDTMDDFEAIAYSMELFAEILEIDKEIERRFEDMSAARTAKIEALKALNDERKNRPESFKSWLKSNDTVNSYLAAKENGSAKSVVKTAGF
ncbi:MAG: hypothetical protein IKA00_11210 [Prevotella sp.]|nr:hypothetical protein [Prevotella sp.]